MTSTCKCSITFRLQLLARCWVSLGGVECRLTTFIKGTGHLVGSLCRSKLALNALVRLTRYRRRCFGMNKTTVSGGLELCRHMSIVDGDARQGLLSDERRASHPRRVLDNNGLCRPTSYLAHQKYPFLRTTRRYLTTFRQRVACQGLQHCQRQMEAGHKPKTKHANCQTATTTAMLSSRTYNDQTR